MVRWEYCIVVRTHSECLKLAELADLGYRGWEMAGVCKNEYTTSYFFKRLDTRNYG